MSNAPIEFKAALTNDELYAVEKAYQEKTAMLGANRRLAIAILSQSKEGLRKAVCSEPDSPARA